MTGASPGITEESLVSFSEYTFGSSCNCVFNQNFRRLFNTVGPEGTERQVLVVFWCVKASCPLKRPVTQSGDGLCSHSPALEEPSYLS